MKARGATTVELVIVLPVFVAMSLYGLYLTELVRVNVKLQEASRFAVWEMTGHLTSDYGQASHRRAFDQARAIVEKDTVARFIDLDSVDDRPPGSLAAEYKGLSVTVTDEHTVMPEGRVPVPPASGGLAGQVTAAAGTLTALAKRWGFNVDGRVAATVRMRLVSRLLPQDLEQSLHSHLTLVADGWQLVDGADSVIRNQRAGSHSNGSDESGLHRQVSRMTFLGVRGALGGLQGVGAATGALRNLDLPAFTGTFVVSHNYQGKSPDRDCFARGIQTTPNPSPSGLNNLKKVARLDWGLPHCFDTAPFRDVAAYDQALYAQMFQARGPYFMGCVHPQADDPTATRKPNGGDASLDHTPCAD